MDSRLIWCSPYFGGLFLRIWTADEYDIRLYFGWLLLRICTADEYGARFILAGFCWARRQWVNMIFSRISSCFYFG